MPAAVPPRSTECHRVFCGPVRRHRRRSTPLDAHLLKRPVGRRSRKPTGRYRLKDHGDGSIGAVSFTRCRIEPDEAEKSREATMAGPALAYAYRYPHASTLEGTPTGANLRLATWSARGSPHPHFFEGRLRRPGRAADLLRGLVEVVQSRFYLPPAMMARIMAQADPVVTGSGDLLRFEAFSACCSTYGRVDFLPEAIDGTWHSRGTTNVDFNSPMRAALARIRDADQVHLAVGSDEVSLRKGTEAVVERKVALPVRWLKGFVEVQAYQARMVRKLEIAGFEAARFLRSLPRG